MLIGYNNDVEHRGKTFHIQTEDRGQNDDKIETQLFHGGAILDTKITAYAELVEGLEGKARNKKIKAIMKASHRSLFKKLLAGKYDEMVGLDPIEKPKEAVEEKTESFQPGQDRVPQAAVELERDGIEALEEEAKNEGFQDPAQEEHVGLSQLKDKLAGLKEKKESAGGSETMMEESDVAETSVMSPPSDMELSFEGETSTVDEDSAAEPVDDDAGETGQFQAIAQQKAVQSDVPETGVKAWRGCAEPEEDLSLTELVEESLAANR